MRFRAGIDIEKLQFSRRDPHFLIQLAPRAVFHALIDLHSSAGVSPEVIVRAFSQKELSLVVHADDAGCALDQCPVSDNLPQVLYISAHLAILPSLKCTRHRDT